MIKLRRLNQYWRSFYMQYNTNKCIDENQDNKTLKDMTKSGKQRKWREKKIDNVSYADIEEILKIKKEFNVKKKRNILEYKPTDEDYIKYNKVKKRGNNIEFKPTDQGYKKLHNIWIGKSKLSPICNWTRDMKNTYQA